MHMNTALQHGGWLCCTCPMSPPSANLRRSSSSNPCSTLASDYPDYGMNDPDPHAIREHDRLLATASPTSTSAPTDREENMAPARNRDDDEDAEEEEDAAASAPLLGVYGSQELLSPEGAASQFSESGDTAPNSAHQRLLKGFCAYSVAGEVRRPPQTDLWATSADYYDSGTPFHQVFAIVSASLFLPVVLETYARQNGVLATDDRTTPCPPSGAGAGGSPAPSDEFDGLRCVVRLGGTWIDTGKSSRVESNGSFPRRPSILLATPATTTWADDSPISVRADQLLSRSWSTRLLWPFKL